VTTFEAWEAAGRAFDAVVAGTALHWVDRETRLDTNDYWNLAGEQLGNFPQGSEQERGATEEGGFAEWGFPP
jgi:hypothetical protein